MTDRPIIFSAPMVNALLAGRKTMTRRIIKPQPEEHPGMNCRRLSFFNKRGDVVVDTWLGNAGMYTPYSVGDRLWVRETHALFIGGRNLGEDDALFYRASDDADGAGPWTPSIHMPRKLSRLTLTVTAVKVERLTSISEADAMAEGALPMLMDDDGKFYEDARFGTRYCGFAGIWTHLHGEAAWDENPWVVALSFSVERRNIDG